MKLAITATILFLTACGATTTNAQAKKNSKPRKPATVTTATPTATPEVVPEPTPVVPKKNERPDGGKKNAREAKGDAKDDKAYTPTYFYTFERSGFSYSPIKIEHDATGKGQISFKKDAYEDVWTDPLTLSAKTLENLNKAFEELNFVDSNESYQYSKDYPHMGNVTITLKQNGKERTAKYNWTENKSAKFLMDEYRRIANEYTWRFEMLTARENQPLQTPGLMDLVVTYYDRNELTDPPHLVPFLTELSEDERLPLIARNRAGKLIEKINKKKGDK